jgi:hypothetical protein
MKKVLVIAAVLACAHGVFGQGSVNFLNRVTGTSTGAQAPYYAPIYGVDPANPFLQKSGQSAAGNPVGGVVYGGALLAGTGFTVQLWGAGGANAASDASFSLLANGTSSFRTGGGAGIISAVTGVTSLNGVPGGAGSRGSFELRVWDNKGGTVTDWTSVLANPSVARGVSAIFSPDFDLGGGSVQPPGLIGLQSFQLVQVPEPSTIALALAGGVGLLFMRRRNK